MKVIEIIDQIQKYIQISVSMERTIALLNDEDDDIMAKERIVSMAEAFRNKAFDLMRKNDLRFIILTVDRCKNCQEDITLKTYQNI